MNRPQQTYNIPSPWPEQPWSGDFWCKSVLFPALQYSEGDQAGKKELLRATDYNGKLWPSHQNHGITMLLIFLRDSQLLFNHIWAGPEKLLAWLVTVRPVNSLWVMLAMLA
ncbi:unnamed protein product [Durusdinium trenchii]|uniref:Uncharacterized protein n=1 Tax=Durusdinium trenchii TaxID=1381693 RepID=A0ABP0RN01_9DINO